MDSNYSSRPAHPSSHTTPPPRNSERDLALDAVDHHRDDRRGRQPLRQPAQRERLARRHRRPRHRQVGLRPKGVGEQGMDPRAGPARRPGALHRAAMPAEAPSSGSDEQQPTHDPTAELAASSLALVIGPVGGEPIAEPLPPPASSQRLSAPPVATRIADLCVTRGAAVPRSDAPPPLLGSARAPGDGPGGARPAPFAARAVEPTPATHAILTVLKAGEIVCQAL